MAWVKDLQSGMYINCVYCGHRYGPKASTPASMAEVLKAHIETCPRHPMSRLKADLMAAVDLLSNWDNSIEWMGKKDAFLARVRKGK